jgi:transcriptional regulator with XRE-family HTH domain
MRSPGKQKRPHNDMYRLAVGERVRELRAATGISQEQLAHKVEMSRRYLSGIERGEANPTLDQLERLASGLGVQPSALLPDRK